MAVIELHPDDVENLPPAEPPRHPLGEVTAIDEHTGLPIVRRASVEHRGTSEPQRGTPVEHSPRASNEGEKHEAKPQSDRPILHQSADRAELVRQAKDYARLFENGLKASTQGIKGARVDSVRDEKSPVRLDEKIQKEGQPVETIPDILAGRIIADSHEAHQKAAKGVHDNFSVVRDIDEFKDGDPDYHYHAHKIQVQVTPQLSAEVHIVPKEIAEAGFDQHADYQRAREADLAGDEKAEKQATAVARKINDEAMRKFEERQSNPEEEGGSGTPERGAGASKGAPDADSKPKPARLAKGVTVLVGDSHGIVRGGNPNFASGGRWSVETPDGTKTFKGSELTPISPQKPKDGSPWTGVDADKTLFHYDDKWKGPNHVGKPVPAMVDHVKKMLDDGKDVRIFTARVADDPKGVARAAIEAATHRALGRALPVTHEKDRWMESLYDDRAHSVEPNTGKVLA